MSCGISSNRLNAYVNLDTIQANISNVVILSYTFCQAGNDHCHHGKHEKPVYVTVLGPPAAW